jgi:hypothetical protein
LYTPRSPLTTPAEARFSTKEWNGLEEGTSENVPAETRDELLTTYDSVIANVARAAMKRFAFFIKNYVKFEIWVEI